MLPFQRKISKHNVRIFSSIAVIHLFTSHKFFLTVLIFKTCIHIFKLRVLPVKQVEAGFIRFAKLLSILQMKQMVSPKPDLKLF